MNILKDLFYFDESPKIYNHKGGSGEDMDPNEDLKYIDQKSGIGIDYLMTDIMDVLKANSIKIYNFFIGWVLTPIVFGSFAPALPFFLVMGVVYAMFNYIYKVIEKF